MSLLVAAAVAVHNTGRIDTRKQWLGCPFYIFPSFVIVDFCCAIASSFSFILISHLLCIGPFSLAVNGRGGEENGVVCGSTMSARAKSQKVETGGKKRNKSSKLSRLCTCSLVV